MQAWVGVYKYGYQLIKKNLNFSLFYINNLMNSPTPPHSPPQRKLFEFTLEKTRIGIGLVAKKKFGSQIT
jgi:hypothetical protein